MHSLIVRLLSVFRLQLGLVSSAINHLLLIVQYVVTYCPALVAQPSFQGMFIVRERSNSVFLLDNVEKFNSYDLSEVAKASVRIDSCSLIS